MSIFTRHWELKLLALAFSAGLWVFVMTSEKTNLVVFLPLELDPVPAGLVVTDKRPESVEVQLHGLRSALSRVSPESLRVRVSLAGARPGDLVVSLGPEQIVVPPGVRVLRVTPAVLRVALAAGGGWAPPPPRRHPRRGQRGAADDRAGLPPRAPARGDPSRASWCRQGPPRRGARYAAVGAHARGGARLGSPVGRGRCL